MATPTVSSKFPTYSASGTTIDPGWMWILSIGGLAVMWGMWPSARPFIVVVAFIIAFILWITRGGMIGSQVSTVVSGKA